MTTMTTNKTKQWASLVAVFLGLVMLAGNAGAESKRPAFSGTVNLNQATVDELQELPGVGPSKAEAILAFRKARGGFKKVEDLLRVKGIGRKTFLKLKPFLALSGPGLIKRGGEVTAANDQGGRPRRAANK